MDALIIMHLQNDYLDCGSIGIPNSLEIIPIINRLKQKFKVVIFVKDCHPFDHISFQTQPKHCIKNTKGVEIHKGVDICSSDYIIHKGLLTLYDSDSAFYDAQIIQKETKLNSILETNNIKNVYICGLTFENEIFSTALDCTKFRYKTYVILDAVCCKNASNQNKVLNFIKTIGVNIVPSDSICNNIPEIIESI